MQEIDKLLRILQENYGVYIGEKNLDRLVYVVVGYQLCIKMHCGNTFEVLSGFQRFVEKHFRLGITDKSWVAIINDNCSSPSAAFDMFYFLWNCYQKENLKGRPNETQGSVNAKI